MYCRKPINVFNCKSIRLKNLQLLLQFRLGLRIDLVLSIDNGIALYLILIFYGIKNLVSKPDGQQLLLIYLEEFCHNGNLAALRLTLSTLILLYIGVSISNAADNCRCNRPCSSLSSFIFFPNIIIKLLYLVLKTIFGRIDW